MLYTYNVTLNDDSNYNYTGFVLADNFKEANNKVCRFCGDDIESCYITLLHEADELEGVIPCSFRDLKYIFEKSN